MRRVIRKIFWILFTGSLLLLLLIYGIISHTSLPAKGITHLVNRTIPERMNVKTSIGAVRGDLFNGLRFSDLSIYTWRNKEKMEIVHIGEVRLRYHLTELLGGTYVFSEMTLIDPVGRFDSEVRDYLRGEDQGDKTYSTEEGREPLFGVEHFEIREGQFVYRTSSGECCTFDEMFFKGRIRRENGDLFTHLQSASFYWLERDLRVHNMQLTTIHAHDSLLVDRLSIETSNSTVHGYGSLRDLSEPDLRWQIKESSVALEEINRVLGLSKDSLRGRVSLNASLRGPLDRLRIETELAGSINEYRFDGLEIDVLKRGTALDIDHFDLRLAGSSLCGTGGLSVTGNPTYRAEVAFENLDLSSLPRVDLETDLNGAISLVGEAFSSENLHIEADLRIGESRVGVYAVDACTGHVSLSGTAIFAEQPVVLRTSETTWHLEGEMGFNGQVLTHNRIETGDLSYLTDLFHLPHVEGTARAEATVSGDISDPDIHGEVHIDSLSNSKVFFTGCSASMKMDNVRKRRRGSAEIRGTDGEIGTVPIAGLRGYLSFYDSSVRIDSVYADNAEASVETKGTFNQDHGSRRLTLEDLTSRFRAYEITNTDTVYLGLHEDGTFVGQGQFATEEGGFDFSASIDSSGTIESELFLQSVDLNPIVETLKITSGVKGIVDGTIMVNGDIDAPHCDLQVSISNGTVTTISFDTLNCSLTYDQGALDISNVQLIRDNHTVLDCQGIVPLRMSLSGKDSIGFLPHENVVFSLRMTDFSLPPISQLVGSKRPFDGSGNIELNLSGSLTDPVLTVHCSVQGARYDALQFGDIQGQFQYEAGQLTIDYLESSYRGTEYASIGFIPLNLTWPFTELQSKEEQIDITFGMAGDIPAGLIPLFTNKIQRLSGDLDVRFTLSGALEHPILNGDLAMQGGLLQLADLENPITDVQMKMTVNDTLLIVDQFEGKMGKEAVEKDNLFKKLVRLVTFRKKEPPGQLSLQGTVDFATVKELVFDLDLEGEKLFLRPLRQNIDLVADVDLRLSGVRYPNITGSVIISQGLVREAFKPREHVQNGVAPESGGGLGPSLDLNVYIPGNFWIEGSDYLQELGVELRGDVQILKKMTGPEYEFFGTAETMRGKYHIYGNMFRITRGNISFGGIAEFNPNLDIEAETRVGNELIYLNLSGTLLQPEVRLLSQSGYSEKDIIALLTMGTTTSAVDTIGVSGAFESKATNVLGSLIEGELARKARRQLGVDTFELSGDEGAQLAPNETQLTVGKYLSPRVYLEYSRRLAAESEQEIELEYRLNRHLSFLGMRDRRGLYHLQLLLKLDY